MRLLLVFGQEAELGEHREVVGWPLKKVVPRIGWPGASGRSSNLAGASRDGLHCCAELAYGPGAGKDNYVADVVVQRTRERGQRFGQGEVRGRACGPPHDIPRAEASEQFGCLVRPVIDVDAD